MPGRFGFGRDALSPASNLASSMKRVTVDLPSVGSANVLIRTAFIEAVRRGNFFLHSVERIRPRSAGQEGM
jgi:hypothetical protein